MAKLTKTTKYTFIPADPGFPGFPGKPFVPSFFTKICHVTPEYWFTRYIATYCSDPDGYSYLCGYIPEYTLIPERTSCELIFQPEEAEQPPIPAREPTPAELIINLQEGWNASAQSIVPIYVDEAYLFKVGNGTRGALLGLATEPWVPNVGQLPFGIMFSDGKAQVYEKGVFGDSLGDFFRGEEFIIGRGENYILYYNITAGIMSLTFAIPAAPTVPLHLFAMLYQGGDTVLT